MIAVLQQQVADVRVDAVVRQAHVRERALRQVVLDCVVTELLGRLDLDRQPPELHASGNSRLASGSRSVASTGAYMRSLIVASVPPSFAACVAASSTEFASTWSSATAASTAPIAAASSPPSRFAPTIIVSAAAGVSLHWIRPDILGVNGMLMSASGRQRYPRSARMTRQSCASASIAPPAKQ